MRKFVLYSAALSTLALAGCYEKEAEAQLAPPNYSPRYTHVTRVAPDGRTKQVLVPEACLGAGDPALPPPGCANNANLQRMVERKSDLTYGRPLGPAPAAPAARAAQDYIDGDRARALGGGVKNIEPRDQAAATTEPEREDR
ncbi:MAG TPA: hypothetical protein VH858_07185 [Hyphomicrobiales bacterium]|jgi:hypothetical protein